MASRSSHGLTDERTGVMYALSAYAIWGVAPVYFVLVGFASAFEVLAHRIVWSVPLLGVLVWFGAQWQKLPMRTVLKLLACSVLLSVNWLTFIYGIHEGKISETSLGYFINPLLSVLLAVLLLGERMSRRQWLATLIAASGVVLELVSVGYFPWIALSLAVSFAIYSVVRRQIQVPAALGLGIETIALAPIALLYLIVSDSLFSRSMSETLLLGVGGLVTVVPLICFGAAARRLPLTVMGHFQYLAPTISLLIAVFYYGETVSTGRWVSFGFVWVALIVFVTDGALQRRVSVAR